MTLPPTAIVTAAGAKKKLAVPVTPIEADVGNPPDGGGVAVGGADVGGADVGGGGWVAPTVGTAVAEGSAVAVGAVVGEAAAALAATVATLVDVRVADGDAAVVATATVGVDVDFSDDPPQAANAAAETARKQSTRMRTNTLRRGCSLTVPHISLSGYDLPHKASGRYASTGRRL